MIRASTDTPIKVIKVNQIKISPEVKGNLVIKPIRNKVVWNNKNTESFQAKIRKNNLFNLSIKVYWSKSTNWTNVNDISW